MFTVPTIETFTEEDRQGLEGFFGLWSRLLIYMKADNLEQTADNCATERKSSDSGYTKEGNSSAATG